MKFQMADYRWLAGSFAAALVLLQVGCASIAQVALITLGVVVVSFAESQAH